MNKSCLTILIREGFDDFNKICWTELNLARYNITYEHITKLEMLVLSTSNSYTPDTWTFVAEKQAWWKWTKGLP